MENVATLLSRAYSQEKITNGGYRIVELSHGSDGLTKCLFQIPKELQNGKPLGFTIIYNRDTNECRMFDWSGIEDEILHYKVAQDVIDHLFTSY